MPGVAGPMLGGAAPAGRAGVWVDGRGLDPGWLRGGGGPDLVTAPGRPHGGETRRAPPGGASPAPGADPHDPTPGGRLTDLCGLGGMVRTPLGTLTWAASDHSVSAHPGPGAAHPGSGGLRGAGGPPPGGAGAAS